jgi:hypothetical protein
METPSGGRTTYVVGVHVNIEPRGLEKFTPPGDGDIICPACETKFDPSGPYRRLGGNRFSSA